MRILSQWVKKTPLIALSILNSVDSEYTNFVDGNKNSYLLFGSGWSENVNYGAKVMECKDSQDMLMTTKCDLSYECVNCVESYGLRYSMGCKGCRGSYFLYSCRNCSDCFGCANLSNKQYCIFNEQYTKEKYFKKLEEFRLGNYDAVTELKKRFTTDVYLKALHRYATIFGSQDCTGDNILNSKNAKVCFDIFMEAEDTKYLYGCLTLKDCYDGNGMYQQEISSECVDANVGSHNFSGITIYNSTNVEYAWNCHSCKDIFGCVGLRNKQYCILNKQYSKEEYETLLPRIIEAMNMKPYVDRGGREYHYGEFFPTEISPFAYNETIAQEYYSLTPQEAGTLKFPWREADKKAYAASLEGDKIPADITAVADDILKETLGCLHAGTCNHQCTTAFKLIPAELAFYKRLNIPLPRLCPNCRHYERLAKRNPLTLWKRLCMCAGTHSEKDVHMNTTAHFHGDARCPNTFATSYSPEKPEVVYCEQCYQAEVV